MTKLWILLIFSLLTTEVFASENEVIKEEVKHYSLNFGLGTCLNFAENTNPDICFHIGADYIFNEDLSMVGFSYHKINWNSDLRIYICVNKCIIKGNNDFDAYYFYYRFPLGKFTLAFGPSLFDNGNLYLFPAATVGYLNNITDWWGFDIAASAFYLEIHDYLFIYLYGGVRVYL